MIQFTPDAVAKCFGTVVADVNKMNNSSVNAWFKSTFPEVAQIVNQNPSLFTSLASSGIIKIPSKPNASKNKFNAQAANREANAYNSTISKIKVAFAIDLRSAMACAGYSPEQIQKAVDAFGRLFGTAYGFK